MTYIRVNVDSISV